MHPYLNGIYNCYNYGGSSIAYESGGSPYLSKGVSQEAYNELVTPPPLRLGQETPNCSKVIFNSSRSSCLRITKKHRKKIRKLKISHHSDEKETVQRERIDSEDDKATTIEKRFNNDDKTVSLEGGTMPIDSTFKQHITGKVIELELEGDDIGLYRFMEEVNKYRNEFICKEKSDTKKNPLYAESNTEGYDNFHYDATAGSNLTTKIENFLDYYKLISGKYGRLSSPDVKELIIKAMYFKIYLLKHFKDVLFLADKKNITPSDYKQSTYGLPATETAKMLGRNECDESTFADYAVWNVAPPPGGFASKGSTTNLLKYDNGPTSYHSEDFQLSNRHIQSENSDVHEVRRPYSQGRRSQPSDIYYLHSGNDSDEASLGHHAKESESNDDGADGRVLQPGNPSAVPHIAKTLRRWPDSPVDARPFSSVVCASFESSSADEISDEGSGGSDHVHECDEYCAMPCKASGIPVYQGRSGLTRGCVGQKPRVRSVEVKYNDKVSLGDVAVSHNGDRNLSVSPASSVGDRNVPSGSFSKCSLAENSLRSKDRRLSSPKNIRNSTFNSPVALKNSSPKLNTKLPPVASPSLRKSSRVANGESNVGRVKRIPSGREGLRCNSRNSFRDGSEDRPLKDESPKLPGGRKTPTKSSPSFVSSRPNRNAPLDNVSKKPQEISGLRTETRIESPPPQPRRSPHTIQNKKYKSNSSLSRFSGDDYSSCRELRTTLSSSETRINSKSELTKYSSTRIRVTSLERNKDSIVSRIMSGNTCSKENPLNKEPSNSTSSLTGSPLPLKKKQNKSFNSRRTASPSNLSSVRQHSQNGDSAGLYKKPSHPIFDRSSPSTKVNRANTPTNSENKTKRVAHETKEDKNIETKLDRAAKNADNKRFVVASKADVPVFSARIRNDKVSSHKKGEKYPSSHKFRSCVDKRKGYTKKLSSHTSDKPADNTVSGTLNFQENIDTADEFISGTIKTTTVNVPDNRYSKLPERNVPQHLPALTPESRKDVGSEVANFYNEGARSPTSLAKDVRDTSTNGHQTMGEGKQPGDIQDRKIYSEKKTLNSMEEQIYNNEVTFSNKKNNLEQHKFREIDKTKLSKIIDISLLYNLKLNGEILNDQFEAIISTLRKVAESIDSSETESSEDKNILCTLPRGTCVRQNCPDLKENSKNLENNGSHCKQNDKEWMAYSDPSISFQDEHEDYRCINRNDSHGFTSPNHCLQNDLYKSTEKTNGLSVITENPEVGKPVVGSHSILRKTNSESTFRVREETAALDKPKIDRLSSMSYLTKSRELLHHLENEYRLLKGEEAVCGPSKSTATLRTEARSLAEKFSAVLEPPDDSPHSRSEDRYVAGLSCMRCDHHTILPFVKNRSRSVSSYQGDKHSTNTTFLRQTPTEYSNPFHVIPHRDTNCTDVPVDINAEGNTTADCIPDNDDENHQRSLSLPKSFLSDKYGFNGIKTALTSVSFPWRRDPLDSSQKRWSKIDGCTQDSHVYLPNGVAIPDDAPFFISQNCPAVEASSIASCSISNASPSGSCREQNVRRSSAFSRSSISQSEWDIRRPWSAIEPGGSSLSQSAFRLAELTGGCVESQSHGTSVVTRNEAPLSMPYQTNANHAHQNSPEGMFQKFKKSLSLRLNKKTSRCESPSLEMSLCSLPVEGQVTITDEIPTVVTSPSKIQVKEEESKSSYFKFGHPIFRSSKERRKAKLKDVRSSKCSSGDSGDSGIEIVSRTSTLTEETSSKEEEANSEIISSYLENNNITEDESSNNSSTVSNNGDKGVRRAHSDMSTRPTSKLLSCSEFAHRQSLGRQYSSPQPIKLRPHHRLPNYNSANSFQANRRPNRGSTHMRRSVSQPLDLDKSFQAQVSLHKMRSSDEEPAKRRQRRPSVDNLLNDDNTSEEGASDCEDVKPEIKFSLDEEASFIVYAEALWDHVSLDSDELVFKAGDQITVIDSSDKDWWWGRISLRSGWFPASFVRLLVNQEDHQTEPDGSDITSDWASPTLSVSSLSQDQIRSNVINEILSTERDYVKHLRDVVEGYMKQVHKRPDMFNEESVVTIFGNIETLFSFHTQFLAELEKCFVCEEPHLSCIGECFIQNKLGFEIYSEYCNNHPSAVSELQQLYQDQKYIHFFEACRLLQEMIDISLDGFLLTPVQKICKYPLQLQELLKYTQPSHPDFTSVLGAMQAMREVALLVNERRRRMECLEKIATWQKTVEGWEGSDLLDDSSQLIYQGEVIKGGGTSWPKEVSLFLFDHQLVYCKRDLLKRNTYVYRGRINTDLCEVIDINWDPTRNSTLQNSWKILCLHKNKTYIFACKTCEDKTKWLASFKKERELVAIDEASGFVASEKQKQAARLAARNHKNKPKKPKTVKSHKRTQAMTYAQAKLLVNDGDLGPNSLSLRSAQESRKKGLWFSFGGHKKSRSSGRSSKQNSLTNP